jgi:hypothetical protein
MMKINPLAIQVHGLGKLEGTIAFDGEKFVFEAADGSLFDGPAYLQKYTQWMKEDLGVENPSPEELLRYIVLRTWGRMSGAFYLGGEGPEMTRKDYRREADNLIREVLRRSREEQQTKRHAHEEAHRNGTPTPATRGDGHPDRPETGDEDQPAEDQSVCRLRQN